MDQSDFNTVRNSAALVKPSRTNSWFMLLFLLLFFSFNGVAQIGPNCNSLCFGPGGDVVVNKNTTLTISVNTFYNSIRVDNGGTLIVQANSILYVGLVNTNADTKVVDFQNGSSVNIQQDASLVVNGLLNNSNNSNGVAFNGSVSVTGNVTAGSGSIIGGGGTLDATGSISTAGSGLIFGSDGACPLGPCSGSTLNCSASAGVIGTNQTICNGGTPAALTSPIAGTGSGTITYEWQTNATGSYELIPNEKSLTYTPPALTATTSYKRRTVLVSGGTTCKSAYTIPITITVNRAPAGLSYTVPSPSYCGGTIITANSATLTTAGSPAATYAVSPALPAGLSLNTTTGQITGTPTTAVASAGYTVTASNTSGCGTATSVVTITVNAAPTLAVITTPSALCSGGSLNPTAPTVTANGSPVIASGWQLETAVASGIFANLTVPYTVAFADNGKKIQYYATNGCGTTNSNQEVVTINPAPLGGTATATSANLCPGSSTTISLSGNTGSTIQWQQSANVSTGWASVTGGSGATTAAYTTPTLTATTYYRAVITSGSCTANSATATITVNTVTKTWDGVPPSPWFIDGVPTIDAPTINDIVIINEDFNTSSLNGGDLNAGCLTINTGKTLTITAGKNVTIQNDLTIKSGAILDVLDQGSLRMVEDSGIVTNEGNGTTRVHRFTTPYKKYDYVYWSTPVKNTAISSAINTPFQSWRTNYAFEYKPENFSDTDNDGLDDDGNDWSFVDTMIPGKGYIVMVPDPPTVSTIPGPTPKDPVAEVVFSGEVNNGKKIISTIVADASYLLGNPYPSAIDADLFLQQNQNTLGGTLYFWTHNTAIRNRTALANAGSGAYAYTSDDYATYNGTGGVGVFDIGALTGSALSDPNRTVSGLDKKPTGKIAAAQGFFASSLKVPLGDIVFNNSMRVAGTTEVDGTGVNQQFFRTSSSAKAKTASALEKNRIWLDLKNSQGAFKQTLVGYISGATNDYDNLFDGASYDGNDFVDFYSINQDMNLTIQGRALPFDENDTVPLGFKTTIAGSFTINIDEVDGALTNQAVYLEDKLTNTVTNLKTGDYTFTTATGTFDDRFVLRYTDKTLGLNETDQADGILVFYSNNYKTLIIKNNVMDATVNSVVLFNTTGQRIANFDIKDSGQTNLHIPIKNIPSGIYIVKVKTTKGESSKKVIVN